MPTPPQRKGRAARLTLAVFGALCAGVALYAALGFWVVPRVIKAEVVGQIDRLYHRKATLAEVTFNPFTLRLEARGFNMPDRDGRFLLGFDRLVVEPAAVQSLWRGVPTLRSILLVEPRVRIVVRPGGGLNLMDLVPKATSPAPFVMPDLQLDHMVLRGGQIGFLDSSRPSRPAPFAKTFSSVGLTLDGFRTTRERALYDLKAVGDGGERLAASGALALAPLAVDGAVSLHGLKIAPLIQAAGSPLACALTSGDLDAAGRYRIAARGPAVTLALEGGTATLTQAVLRSPDRTDDWVTVPALTVTGLEADLARRTATLGQVTLDRPAIKAWRDRNGAINLTQCLAPSKPSAPAAPAQAPQASPAPGWTLAAPLVRVAGARLAFDDRAPATPVSLLASPIDLTLKGLGWPLAGAVGIAAEATLDRGGKVAATGSLLPAKGSAELDLQAGDVDLARFQPYVAQASGVKVLAARLSAHGHVRYAPGDGATYRGVVGVDGLHTIDRFLRQDFINWRSVRFDGVEASSQPMKVKIALVTAQEPYARVTVEPNAVLNLQTVMDQSAASGPPPPQSSKPARAARGARRASPPPPAPNAGLPVQIALVRINNGRMDFSDQSLTPNFTTGIQALNGKVTGLSGAPGSSAVIDLVGQVDRYAPLKIDGQTNPLAAETFTDVTMDFRNIEMTTFSPYAGKFAGYRIEKGKLNLGMRYVILRESLHATHKVVINQLQLGEKVSSAEAVKLPVKLIVSLLKDRHGVIDIPVNVDGDLNDPRFQVWPVIWKVVGNTFDKVVTAPFALLGGLVGHGEELRYVDFAPGSATLDPVGHDKLLTLAKALAERPALNLNIPMVVEPAVDGPALVEARFQAEVAAQALAMSPLSTLKAANPKTATRRSILEALYRKQMGKAPEIPPTPPVPGLSKAEARARADEAAAAWLEARLRERVIITEADFKALGRARAEAAEADLLADKTAVDPSRVFIVAAKPSQAKGVRMALAVE